MSEGSYQHSARPIDTSRRAARSLRVCIIAANTFTFDSRFLRSASSLADDGHEVTVVAWAGPGLPDAEQLGPQVRLVRLGLDRRLSAAFRPLPEIVGRSLCRLIGLDSTVEVLPATEPRGLDRIRHPLRRTVEIIANMRRVGPWVRAVRDAAPGSDVYHCQSLVVLPVALGAADAEGGALVYDVADYHTGAERLARMPAVVRNVIGRRERSWARRASGMLAVSDPVADLVARRWGSDRPQVLFNAPPPWKPEIPGALQSSRIRDATGIAPHRPVVLYQGGLSIERGIEELLAASRMPVMEATDAAIVFMGYGRLEGDLRRQAAASDGRIHVLDAVPPDELLDWTAGADVAFVGQPARTLNWKLNLPNKLFESMMAGVPVVVSSGSEQCRLVTAEGVGLCANPRPDAIAAALTRLLLAPVGERTALRQRCRSVALNRYTWAKTAGGLVDTYRRLAEA